MTISALDLYNKYFLERNFERLDLFRIIADKFNVQRVLYPGCFVHVTPSFVFPDVVYVDSDKQANQFFGEPEVVNFINKRKMYPQAAKFTFYSADYKLGIEEMPGSFDLLISQYAGFVGQHGKQYLRTGGLLLVNNSHGDAGMADIDVDYQLIGVFSVINENYNFDDNDLDAYFVPKSHDEITKEYLEKLQKGIRYKKLASEYLFRKVH